MKSLCKQCKHYQGKQRLNRPNFLGERTDRGITFDWIIVCNKLGYFASDPIKKCDGYESADYPKGGSDADILRTKELTE
jgi:hypothetical protein